MSLTLAQAPTAASRQYATRDHLSAIGAITPGGKLFIHVQEMP